MTSANEIFILSFAFFNARAIAAFRMLLLLPRPPRYLPRIANTLFFDCCAMLIHSVLIYSMAASDIRADAAVAVAVAAAIVTVICWHCYLDYIVSS